MFRQNRATHAAILLLMTAVAFAQSTQHRDTPGETAGGQALTPTLVKTGLYMISGGGCNSLLRLSANGFILVDGKLPGTYDTILELAKKLSYSEQPIRILINTDYHENHTANNAKFLEGGTAVVAHENVSKYMARHNPQAKSTAPSKTYENELTIRLGGVEARLLHFGNAHTNGDTVVYFPNLKVVAVGDLFAQIPDPDFAAGGSLVAWGPVLDQILKLDFDVVVPGSGPSVSRADLQAFKTKIDTLVSRAAGLVKEGVPKGQLMSRLKTDDLGWRFSFTGRQLDRFYGELAGWKQAAVGFLQGRPTI
jgi:glyoxylase-like metal-dependent hydrolase (beta-lactamase superfamily II)